MLMVIVPILNRELRGGARRAATFRRRCSFSIAFLLALGILYLFTSITNRQQFGPRVMAGFAESMFANTVLIQMLLTIWLVPACTAILIAGENERRTLSFLAMTRLTSAEIIIGKLAAGLAQHAAWLATGLPVLILLPVFGGVDPRWVLLAMSGTVSTACFVAGLSILVSTGASRARRAVGEAVGLATAWFVVPPVVRLFAPISLPRVWHWAAPVNDWVLASSPSSILMLLWHLPSAPPWTLSGTFVAMMSLQLVAAGLFTLWAVARFRSACRRHEENSGAEAGVQRPAAGIATAIRRIAPVKRPPCWDNPMLWKELYTTRRRTLAEKFGVLVALAFVALLVWVIYPFAMRAIFEQFHFLRSSDSEIRRLEFNEILRIITSLLQFLAILAAAAIAATCLTEERARQTWDSLLATPLSASEIIQAKMIGAAWRIRWVALFLVALWLLGLFAGSIHPLGFAAAIILLAASIWFALALGTYMSLVSRDTALASNRAMIPVLLLSISCLACYFARGASSVLLGAGSAPFVNWLSLVSYADVHEIIAAGGLQPFHVIRQVGLHTQERPAAVLTAFLLTTVASLVAGMWFHGAAIANFDKATGRPHGASSRNGSARGGLVASRRAGMPAGASI
jgi:ABC-type transport system involved in multi-copper enzyme maturation permease subunit